MKETITCCYIGYGMKPLAIEVPKDDALRSLQEWVQGGVGVLAVRSDGIKFCVNDESVLNGQQPNMAVYADEGMAAAGYQSQLDNSTVKDGDLYTVLCGPIVAARSDDKGNLVDLHPEDIARLQQERPDSTRAVEEIAYMKSGMPPIGRDGESIFDSIRDGTAKTVFVEAGFGRVPSTEEVLRDLDKAAAKNAGSVPQTHEKIDTNHRRSL